MEQDIKNKEPLIRKYNAAPRSRQKLHPKGFNANAWEVTVEKAPVQWQQSYQSFWEYIYSTAQSSCVSRPPAANPS